MKKISLIIVILSLFLTSCGIYKYSPVKEDDYDVEKRVKRNIEEGKGISFGKMRNRGGTFDFASSNELWRASIETLDFVTLPLKLKKDFFNNFVLGYFKSYRLLALSITEFVLLR